MRTLIAAFGLSAALMASAAAQLAGHSSGADTRELLKFPPMMVEHTLANMRDHVAAIQEILQSMGQGDYSAAAGISEKRLGMTSLTAHGAEHASRFMPLPMREMGSAMHRLASEFSVEIVNAGVTGDLKPAIAKLSDVTAQCVGCHAAYRLK